MLEVNDGNFESTMGTGVCVMEFCGDDCPSCEVVKGKLKNAETQYPQVRFGVVEAETNGRLASRFRVSQVPFVVILRDGKVSGALAGGFGSLDAKIGSALRA